MAALQARIIAFTGPVSFLARPSPWTNGIRGRGGVIDQTPLAISARLHTDQVGCTELHIHTTLPVDYGQRPSTTTTLTPSWQGIVAEGQQNHCASPTPVFSRSKYVALLHQITHAPLIHDSVRLILVTRCCSIPSILILILILPTVPPLPPPNPDVTVTPPSTTYVRHYYR